MPRPPRRGHGRRSSTLAAVAVIALALLGGGVIVNARDGSGFDGEVWRAQHDSDALEQENPRSAMVSSLLRDELRPGAERADILRLLGPPERRRGDTDYYELGRSAWGASYEQLAVDYDGGVLVRASLLRG